jgi:PAS domain S-box-containing protein
MNKDYSTKNYSSEAAVILRNTIEWLMEKRVVSGDAYFSEIEMLKLIRELEMCQVELEMLDEQLTDARAAIQQDAEKRYHSDTFDDRQQQLIEKCRRSNERLECILKATNTGTWEWNIQTGEMIYNGRSGEIIGYRLDKISPGNISALQNLVHPDDMKRSAELLGRYIVGELPTYACECRIKHRQGHWVWVQVCGCIITRTAEGRPLTMFGTYTDITERKKNESQREQVTPSLQRAL